jgi:hypothetical protein
VTVKEIQFRRKALNLVRRVTIEVISGGLPND